MSGASRPDDFLSGVSGYVAGIRRTTTSRLADAALDLGQARQVRAIRRAAAHWPPPRRILALSIYRSEVANLMEAERREMERSRHEVQFEAAEVGGAGKFENLNLLISRFHANERDWLIVLDDDVRLPAGFLDSFVFLAERFDLAIAQPAHRRYSHAAWAVTRRRPLSIVRETAFVEVGPVVGFRASTFATLLPFPALRAGWGLDNHWSALAAERGWRIGVVDATPVEHALRPVAASYDHSEAVAEARSFLAERPYVRAAEAQRTLVTHRRW